MVFGKLLDDQPLPPSGLRRANLAPETRVTHRRRILCGQFAVEPGRGLGRRQLIKRHRRERFDGDGPVAKLARLELLNLVEMVGRDDPAPVGFAIDIAHHPPHRFEPADMGLGETLPAMSLLLLPCPAKITHSRWRGCNRAARTCRSLPPFTIRRAA